MYTDILRSREDASINLVSPSADGGNIEARFVQRLEDTIIVYLSSASGCDKACRFCHLTQTRQTMTTYVDVEGYLDQARDVLSLVASEGKLEGVKIVHFNFMARGDALANPHFIHHTADVIGGLESIASEYELIPKFKISTIFPTGVLDRYTEHDLKAWVESVYTLSEHVEFYYSLYSLDTAFRKRWIPKALDPELIGSVFADTCEKIRLHHALIENENTSNVDIFSIQKWLSRYQIQCRMNLVQYNSFGPSCGYEASDDLTKSYQSCMKSSPQIIDVHLVTPVAKDVYASCGMFVS